MTVRNMSGAARRLSPGTIRKDTRCDGRQQEQGGRAAQVRRVTVCGPDGGKVDDGAAVQALQGMLTGTLGDWAMLCYTT